MHPSPIPNKASADQGSDTEQEAAAENKAVAENTAAEVSEEAAAALRTVVTAALDRKAEDLKVLDLAKVSDFTDHFIVCSGSNERQVQAIADAVLDQLRDQGMKPLHVEGYNHGRWILLDFGGALVIHVFLAETRRFYDLERLWSDAPDVTEQFC